MTPPTQTRQALIKSFDPASRTASVLLAGEPAVCLSDVEVDPSIPAKDLTPGRLCTIVFFTPVSPRRSLLFALLPP